MKILIVSKDMIGAWFSLRFQREGNSVDIYLLDGKYKDVLSGIVPTPLLKKPDFNKYDLIVFDSTGNPALAEEARLAAPTIGDGDLNSRLEDDRLYGVKIMELCGINVPKYEYFNNIETAKKYVLDNPKKYVFKPFTAPGGEDQDCATTYVASSPQDLVKYLDKLGQLSSGADFILQEVVSGTEISTEAYFDGRDFHLINATLEEKKFMNENLGPNTGCAGNLVWCYQRPPQIFKQGLMKLRPFLQDMNYRGMVDLNTIAAEDKLYGLEWTPRFGYDASATLFNLVRTPLSRFFYNIAAGMPDPYQFSTEFAVATRISIPPYPSEHDELKKEGVPIKGIEADKLKQTFLYDAKLGDEGELVTAGVNGFVAVPMAVGAEINMAWKNLESRTDEIKIPDRQFRTDLCRTTKQRYDVLNINGWLGV